MEELLKKISNKTARIAVIGVGYVGLPLAIEFAKEGFNVIGIDTDPGKVEAINNGSSYIQDVQKEELTSLVQSERLRATLDYSLLKDIDAISICVPTPLNKTKDPDVSYILDAADKISKFIHAKQLVVLESTTYPGTTRELILPILEETGLKVGEDFYLAFSPERIDPGNKFYKTRNTPKIVAGITPKCTEVAKLLYQQVIDTIVPVSSTETAEVVKLLENTFRSVNIALVNEVAIICNKLKLNVWEVIEAAATKPFGYMSFYPGPGLGGHCLPIDPSYLSWKLRTLDYRARFIELASEINTEMPYFVTNKITDGLNVSRKSVNGSNILVLGVAYKKDIDDIRESPALDIIKILKEKGAEVIFNDPNVPFIKTDELKMSSVVIDEELLKKMDCVVITTDHSGYNWEWITENANLIVDTRNATRGINEDKIIRL
ncbi:MAG: nucleotide sugar dehydrogenase [Desulfobacterales bacterium]|nr:nucleotide sugar dehydrogenase [Desulfobacterales bacterium]